MLGMVLTLSLHLNELGRMVKPKKSNPLGYFFSENPLKFTKSWKKSQIRQDKSFIRIGEITSKNKNSITK